MLPSCDGIYTCTRTYTEAEVHMYLLALGETQVRPAIASKSFAAEG